MNIVQKVVDMYIRWERKGHRTCADCNVKLPRHYSDYHILCPQCWQYNMGYSETKGKGPKK